ncbi:hypothetical protein CEXT_14771 [Caerostris extrusa]|uniref:Uncharacterized protein n=1 Tax=Caerostris extrusa TaxID=172846 RepID=A0AAV4XMS0_CAEEX|nr:hypothetical protein CEXT_14771 [Caerostris extrusa]
MGRKSDTSTHRFAFRSPASPVARVFITQRRMHVEEPEELLIGEMEDSLRGKKDESRMRGRKWTHPHGFQVASRRMDGR